TLGFLAQGTAAGIFLDAARFVGAGTSLVLDLTTGCFTQGASAGIGLGGAQALAGTEARLHAATALRTARLVEAGTAARRTGTIAIGTRRTHRRAGVRTRRTRCRARLATGRHGTGDRG